MFFSVAEFLMFFITAIGFSYYAGPMPLPAIGNLHQLSPEPYKDFMKMRDKCGDIIAVDFGNVRVVILNDYKVIREAFNEMSLSGRPRLEQIIQRCGGRPSGVIVTNGPHWVEQRRFVLKNLRDFGFGKKSIEALVHQEIEELIEGFKKEVGKPIHTQNRFNAAVLNALWSIVTGQRHSHDDPVLVNLIKRVTSGIQQTRSVAIGLFLPWVKKYSPNWLDKIQKTTKKDEL